MPVFGDFFSQRNAQAIKSELVIFIRAIVVRDPSLEGDLANYKRYLPDKEFFQDTRTAVPVRGQDPASMGGPRPWR